MRHYAKRIVNVTYTEVSKNVELRTYPCLKFDGYDGVKLTPAQKDILRARRIHLCIFKDETKTGEWQKVNINLITKKGQWGADILENIVKDVMKKEGDFTLDDEAHLDKMVDMIDTQVTTYNKTILGIIKPKMMRDPKTGRFMKATA